jgi:hypothetical protein
VISYAYVPIYLKLYAKNNSKAFNASDIFSEYKTNIGRIFIFLVVGVLIAIPVAVVAGIVSFVLTITIIGILLLPLVIGAVSLLYQGALMEYIERKKSIGNSFGYSWNVMGSKFWAAIGSVGLFFLMSYIVQNGITLIPYFAFIIDMLADVDSGVAVDPQEFQKSMSVLMIIMFVLVYFVGMLLNIIVQINQGIVFYSLKEDIENINTKSDIDRIGTGE